MIIFQILTVIALLAAVIGYFVAMAKANGNTASGLGAAIGIIAMLTFSAFLGGHPWFWPGVLSFVVPTALFSGIALWCEEFVFTPRPPAKPRGTFPWVP